MLVLSLSILLPRKIEFLGEDSYQKCNQKCKYELPPKIQEEKYGHKTI